MYKSLTGQAVATCCDCVNVILSKICKYTPKIGKVKLGFNVVSGTVSDAWTVGWLPLETQRVCLSVLLVLCDVHVAHS